MYTSYFINAVNWEKILYRKETDIDWEWDREEESGEKKRDKDP